MIDIDETRDLPDRGRAAPELIGADRVWKVIFAEPSSQQGSRRLGITMSLEQDIEHEAVLVQKPSGFLLTKFLSGQRTEVDAPPAQVS